MDFKKLLSPYSENGRTIAGQIKWLLKNGLPQSSVDYAISAVYKRIETGEKFENGHALDQELRQIAKNHFDLEIEEQMKKRIDEVETNLDVAWNRLSKLQKIWEVVRNRA